MERHDTNDLLDIQVVCYSKRNKFPVTLGVMGDEPENTGSRVKDGRLERGWSQKDLADRVTSLLRAAGSARIVKQQSVDQVEKAKLKTIPDWVRFVWATFEASDNDISRQPDRPPLPDDDTVLVRRLPTWVGLGRGGTGDDDEQRIRFSRDLVERELRADPECLLAMIAEGNSMEPQFLGGDQILVDTRRTTLAQPGAFCLWDGDGHVIKYLERIPGSDPALVRVIAANSLYDAHERLLDDIRIVGRVVWFGRRVQ